MDLFPQATCHMRGKLVPPNTDCVSAIRLATDMDKEIIFEWANDPIVRMASFNRTDIPWEIHEEWFNQKMKSPSSHIYILEVNGKPAGQVRFDASGDEKEFTINYSIGADFRGLGLGERILRLGLTAHCCTYEGEATYLALVKPENLSSVSCFRKLGFGMKEETADRIAFTTTLDGCLATSDQMTAESAQREIRVKL
jgi:RimJ/RimL family protein N-acetyltransferase